MNNDYSETRLAGEVPADAARSIGYRSRNNIQTSQRSCSFRNTGHGNVQSIRWIGTLMFRVALVAAILFGFVGSRASVSELVTGEIIETVEVVVSFHVRHHESDSLCESDREFSRRRCVRQCGRNTNLVRCCCRCLNNSFQNRHLSVGHRRPDNSIAPLLI